MVYNPQGEPAAPVADGARAPATEAVRIDLLADVLQRFGRVRLCVNGTSMLPTLWPGDVLMVQRVAASELHPGDVILMQREQRLLCHRLIARVERDSRSFLRTRGDFLSTADPLVPLQDFLGKVEVPRFRASLAWLAPALRAVACVSERPFAWWLRRPPNRQSRLATPRSTQALASFTESQAVDSPAVIAAKRKPPLLAQ